MTNLITIIAKIESLNLSQKQIANLWTLRSDLYQGIIFKDGLVTVENEKGLNQDQIESLIKSLKALPEENQDPVEKEKQTVKEGPFCFDTLEETKKWIDSSVKDIDTAKEVLKEMARVLWIISQRRV